ncbi:uncharacterized protein LOC118341870 [Morone saxatilis]|uniref:uncharacterized protein LOC118341870 n=1 Tax=Morone saxatilis TaxID=34816 RepID=UPI0015E223BF|nr:uncharacterized protein LOC118341870 [Morone saxatilis]
MMTGRRLPSHEPPFPSTPLRLHLQAGQVQAEVVQQRCRLHSVLAGTKTTMFVSVLCFVLLFGVSHASDTVSAAQLGPPSLGFSSSAVLAVVGSGVSAGAQRAGQPLQDPVRGRARDEHAGVPPTGDVHPGNRRARGADGGGDTLFHPPGSVVCDVCSLASEGETDIQENFCHSSYAFKMRLGSVSTVGGDRQLVPTARSRILRWAGGGAERAEGIGGAMAHSALWLQEGGTCTCAGLDSAETNAERGIEDVQVEKGQAKEGGKEGNRAQGEWYLALAQAKEGRLVLTRLVRWTRRDKELKKFIRALLKQSCPEL